MKPVPQDVPADSSVSTSRNPVQARYRLPAMAQALRHRNYRLFFAGQLVSLTGTWMQSVAQGWLVLRLSNSPMLLGLVAAATSLPVLLFSLFGGAVADRVPKRRVLMCTQTVAMLLAFTMAILTYTHLVQVWHIVVMASMLGLVQAFDAPARQAFTIEMVGRDDLLNAIALNSSVFNAARTLGPALAGIVVAAIGEAPAFLLNGFSFLAVLAGLCLMRLPPFTPPAQQDGIRHGSILREGLRYILDEPRIRSLLLLAGCMCLFGFVHVPMLPIFARDILHTDARGLGLLSAASGAGALTAALLLAQFSTKLPRGRVLLGAMLLYPLFLIGFTFTRSLPLAMALLSLVGWASVTGLALTNTLIQTIVPDTLRARVMSVFTMLLMGLSPFGGMAAGALAERIGNVPLVVAGCAGIAWLIVLVGNMLAPDVRRL